MVKEDGGGRREGMEMEGPSKGAVQRDGKWRGKWRAQRRDDEGEHNKGGMARVKASTERGRAKVKRSL